MRWKGAFQNTEKNNKVIANETKTVFFLKTIVIGIQISAVFIKPFS